MGKRGRPVQFGKTQTFRMHPRTIETLRHLASHWGMSRSAVLRELIAREAFETFDAAERSRLGIS